MTQITLHQPNQPPTPVAIRLQRRADRLYLILDGQPLALALSAQAEAWHQLFEPADPPPLAGGGRFLNPTAKNWDWLTPAGVVEYFKRAPNLRTFVADVRQALADSLAGPAEAPAQLEQDLAALRPHLAAILRDDGSLNKSAAARCLGISPGGSSNWQRLSDLAEALESRALPDPSSSSSYQASYPAEEAKNALTKEVRRRRAA